MAKEGVPGPVVVVVVSQWSCSASPAGKRKIRCDRRYPCSHCCAASSSKEKKNLRAAHAWSRRERDELLERLTSLEGLVQGLGIEGRLSLTTKAKASVDGSRGKGKGEGEDRDQNGHKEPDVADITKELGTLVVRDSGSVYYVGNWLWGVIRDEVRYIRQSLQDNSGHIHEGHCYYHDEDEDEDEEIPVPLEAEMAHPDRPGVSFFFHSANNTHADPGNEYEYDEDEEEIYVEGPRPDRLQPLPSKVWYIWQVYVENVDPFIKILHVPTIENAVRESRGKFDFMSRGMEVLMFAISLAAITSLWEDEESENFNTPKERLIARLRLGTERGFSAAGVPSTTDLSVLQALILYRETVAQRDGQRATWTMTGLLVRIAVGMGLHRDGSRFSDDTVSACDAEMRRRVRWHLCRLDARVGDCQVFDIGSIVPRDFDALPPSNLNDSDISPDIHVFKSTLKASSSSSSSSSSRSSPGVIKENLKEQKNDAATIPIHRARDLLAELRKGLGLEMRAYLRPRERPLYLVIQVAVALELTTFEHILHLAEDFFFKSSSSSPSPSSSSHSSHQDGHQVEQEEEEEEDGSSSSEVVNQDQDAHKHKHKQHKYTPFALALALGSLLEHIIYRLADDDEEASPWTSRWGWYLRRRPQGHQKGHGVP
ncbi:hypothetical protein F5Y17DRAFT_463941 [Xylariaceae sp. FL0594]|nr:hypothetical protein F5Y17DRAFT_463941 [Xylariaceae sp. FL0594]